MRHELHTDLYMLIDECGSAEIEIPCRLTWTVTEAVPALRPMGEVLPTSPAEPEGVEDISVEVMLGTNDAGEPIWGRLPEYIHERLVKQFEDKAQFLIEEARERQQSGRAA